MTNPIERVDTPKPVSSLADMVDVSAVDSALRRDAWIKIGVIALLFIKLYWWQLMILNNQYLSDDNWTHGYIIPLFSLYLVYIWREELLTATRRICLLGLPVMLLSVLISLFGVYYSNYWFSQIGIPVMLFGIVLYLAGPKVAKIAFVPIFFLLLAMPLPGSLYNNIALPLQNLAAKMSGALLQIMGAKITVNASQMSIQDKFDPRVYHSMTVAEACSGVRSLMAFVALGVMLAYVENRAFWQRAVIILAGVPITIVCNIIRVTVTGMMFWYGKEELGKDFMHTATGMVLLIPAAILLFALGRVLNLVYVEHEDDDEETPDAPDTSTQEARQV